jgi:hypothetical protein
MTEQQQEIERIVKLADSIGDPQDMLACILRRLDSRYIYSDSRQPIEQLLTLAEKDRAMLLHRIVGASDIHDVLKQRICGAVEFFLRRIGVSAADMKAFKATCLFDPATYNLFAGLGPDGE